MIGFGAAPETMASSGRSGSERRRRECFLHAPTIYQPPAQDSDPDIIIRIRGDTDFNPTDESDVHPLKKAPRRCAEGAFFCYAGSAMLN
jgi:hypothetical protein